MGIGINMITKDRVLNALSKARELQNIGYIKGDWAKDANKKSVDPWDESATCFCGEGAIIGACHFEADATELQATCITFFQVANKQFIELANKILKAKNSTTKISNRSVVPIVNDRHDTTKEMMVKMFDNAIRLVEASTWPTEA